MELRPIRSKRDYQTALREVESEGLKLPADVLIRSYELKHAA